MIFDQLSKAARTPTTAATALTWSEPLPNFNVSINASWTRSSSSNLANQKIQYYSDLSCKTAMGSAIDLGSNTATTHTYLGEAGKNYSYKITSISTGGLESVSECSAAKMIAHSISTLKGLSVGYYHNCAIINGSVQCWGANFAGQLGDGTTTNRSLPAPVVGLTTGVQMVSAGHDQTCAIKNSGVWCWGDNSFGQLGNNSTTNSLVPVPVSGLSSGVQSIIAGGWNTCAITNGAAKYWGSNENGELGNNTTTNSYSPVSVTGLTADVQQLALGTGGFTRCAMTNGTPKCWGQNHVGQLGNNSTVQSNVPVDLHPWY